MLILVCLQKKKKKTLILDNKRTKILNVSFDDNNDDDYQANNKGKMEMNRFCFGEKGTRCVLPAKNFIRN